MVCLPLTSGIISLDFVIFVNAFLYDPGISYSHHDDAFEQGQLVAKTEFAWILRVAALA